MSGNISLKLILFALSIFSSNIYGRLPRLDPDPSPIFIVYHMATINNFDELANEQLQTLDDSGLLEACDNMFVTVVGPHIDQARALFQNSIYADKIIVLHDSVDMNGEFPALAVVNELADEFADAKILYMHAKGIRHYKGPYEESCRWWRLYMEYFVIQHWQNCLDALDTADVCGVLWRIHPRPHFSGNFWWARASYIRTLAPLPKPYLFDNRMDCEFFVGRNPRVRVKEFHNFGNDVPYEINITPDMYRYD